jgi:polar amino acid transport system permease protein
VTWDWAYAWEVLPILLGGLRVTVTLTVLGSVIALTLGLALAIARRSQQRLISIPTALLIDVIRSTPLLIQLYFLFYVLPFYGITLSAFAAGVLGIGLHYATYASEAYRAGIDSVPAGQWDAARSLGFGPVAQWRSVLIPQVYRASIPPLGNYVVGMFKDTAIVSAITTTELFRSAMNESGRTFRYVEPLTLVAVLFLAVSLPAAWLVKRAEGRLARPI